MRIIIYCPWYISTCTVPMASGGINFEGRLLLLSFFIYPITVAFIQVCVPCWGKVFIDKVPWNRHDRVMVMVVDSNKCSQTAFHTQCFFPHLLSHHKAGAINESTVKVGTLRSRGVTWLELGHVVGKKQSFTEMIAPWPLRLIFSPIKVWVEF